MSRLLRGPNNRCNLAVLHPGLGPAKHRVKTGKSSHTFFAVLTAGANLQIYTLVLALLTTECKTGMSFHAFFAVLTAGANWLDDVLVLALLTTECKTGLSFHASSRGPNSRV